MPKPKTNCRFLPGTQLSAGFSLWYHTRFQNTQRKLSAWGSPPNLFSCRTSCHGSQHNGSQPVSEHSDLLTKHPPPLPRSQGAAGDASHRTSCAFQNKHSVGTTNRSHCFFYHSNGLRTSPVYLPGFVSTGGGGEKLHLIQHAGFLI